jgi:hypothetical protein
MTNDQIIELANGQIVKKMNDKILIEISSGCIINAQSTNNDIEIYVVDHDFLSDGYPSEELEKIYRKKLDFHTDSISHEEFDETINDLVSEMKRELNED